MEKEGRGLCVWPDRPAFQAKCKTGAQRQPHNPRQSVCWETERGYRGQARRLPGGAAQKAAGTSLLGNADASEAERPDYWGSRPSSLVLHGPGWSGEGPILSEPRENPDTAGRLTVEILRTERLLSGRYWKELAHGAGCLGVRGASSLTPRRSRASRAFSSDAFTSVRRGPASERAVSGLGHQGPPSLSPAASGPPNQGFRGLQASAAEGAPARGEGAAGEAPRACGEGWAGETPLPGRAV